MVPSSYKTGFFVKNFTPWASLVQVSEDARTIFKRIRAKLMDLQQDPGVGLKSQPMFATNQLSLGNPWD